LPEIILLQSSHFREVTASFLEKSGINVTKPDFVKLQTILAAFSKIPYENVSKIIRYNSLISTKQEVFRLPDTLWHDYQRYSLGGTCFSLTYFLQTILENCGYHCYPVSADMKWGKHVHCAIVVCLEGQNWLCDPGYLLHEPLLLDNMERKIYRTETQGVMISYDLNRYNLATFQGNQINWRYSFNDIPCEQSEFVKWWLQSFGEPTMKGICLTRQEKHGMIYVHNNYFREVNAMGIKKRRVEQNWIGNIVDIFGIPADMLQDAYEITRKYRSSNETR